MRDITLDETIYLRFTTRAFATGVPTTLAGTPVLSVYEENNTTQITAGVSVSVDYDSVTGLNQATIIATTANGYESGKSYDLVITTGTVGGVSVVGEVVGSFTIEASAAATELANGTDGLTAIKADTAAILVDTGTTIPGTITTLDTNIDAILVDTGTTLPASIATIDTNVDSILVDTGTTLPASIATVDTNVDAILVDTGTTLPSTLADMQGATFATSTDSLEALRNRGDAAWTTGAGGTPPQLLQSTTIATLASQTSFTLTAGSSDNDAYNNAIAVITDSSSSVQKAVGTVSDYVGSTKTVTLSSDPAIFTMAVGDTIDIIAALGSSSGGTAPTVEQIRTEMDNNSTQLAAIVADTNELQGDWVNGGRLDLILDATATQTSVNTVDANVDAILVDTGTTLPASIATIDANVDAVLVDTGTTLPASIATIDANVDAVLVDTADMQPKLGTPAGASISADIAAVKADTAATLVDTGTTLPASIATIDGNVDAILVDTGTTLPASIATIDGNVDAILVDTGTTLPASLATIDGNVDAILADTADMQPKLGTPAGASISADVAAVKVDTAATLVDTGTTLPALLPSSLSGNGNMNVNIVEIKGSTTTADAFERAVRSNVIGTVGVGSTTTSIVTSALLPVGVALDQFRPRYLVFADNTTTTSLRGQATDITSSTASATPTFTVTALTTAPVSGDTFVIL